MNFPRNYVREKHFGRQFYLKIQKIEINLRPFRDVLAGISASRALNMQHIIWNAAFLTFYPDFNLNSSYWHVFFYNKSLYYKPCRIKWMEGRLKYRQQFSNKSHMLLICHAEGKICVLVPNNRKRLEENHWTSITPILSRSKSTVCPAQLLTLNSLES